MRWFNIWRPHLTNTRASYGLCNTLRRGVYNSIWMRDGYTMYRILDPAFIGFRLLELVEVLMTSPIFWPD